MDHMPRTTRMTWLDAALLALLAAAAAWLAWRLEARLDYDWRWSELPQYLLRHDPVTGWTPNLLLEGLFATIRLSVWATLLATLVGVTMGICRTSRSLFLRLVSRAYVELVRNLPPLVLVFLFYYFFSDQIMAGLGVDDLARAAPPWAQAALSLLLAPPRQVTVFLSALVTLAAYEGAYITEIVRAGIQSVERGQWEASHALGLSPWQNMRHVVLPLTAQRIVPPLAGQFISTIKDSSIVALISVPELTFQAMELMASTYLTFEIWITVAGLYLLLTLSCSLLARRVELYLFRSEA